MVLIGLYLLQHTIIFMPSKQRPQTKEFVRLGFHSVTIETADGLTLRSFYKAAQPGKPTLVYFHGNGGHLGHRLNRALPYLDKGYGVLFVGYRGYGGNPGKPTEQGLYQDGRASLEFLRQQGVKGKDILLFGESLGAAVVIQMAVEKKYQALILQAPFTNLVDAGKVRYFFVPVNLLLKDRFASDQKMQLIHSPVLIFHGTEDKIVPIRLGRKLYSLANQPKQFIEFQGSFHNNMDAQQVALKSILLIEKLSSKSKEPQAILEMAD